MMIVKEANRVSDVITECNWYKLQSGIRINAEKKLPVMDSLF